MAHSFSSLIQVIIDAVSSGVLLPDSITLQCFLGLRRDDIDVKLIAPLSTAIYFQHIVHLASLQWPVQK